MSRELDALRGGSHALDRVRTRLRAPGVTSPAAPRRSWRPWALVAVPVVAVLAALLTLPLWHEGNPPLRAYRGTDDSAPLDAGAWVHAEENQSALLRFSDNAEVRLEPRASVRLVGIEGRTARLALDHGQARVSVVPGRGADYRVSAGPFEVQVKGTRFRLAWDPANDRFELALHEGRVVLTGCAFGNGFAVAAGQEVEASCRLRKLDVKPIAESPVAVTASASGEPSPPPADSPPQSAVKPAAPPQNTGATSWAALARHGQRQKAWAEVTSQGIENVIQASAPMELILLGDTARDVRELALARRLYQLVRGRAPGSHSAAFAAFALGRLEFDDRGAHREAAEWFGAYLKEEPAGEFAREARGRLMEALHRAGQDSSARQAAGDYLRLYPRGPHAKLAAQLARAEEPHR